MNQGNHPASAGSSKIYEIFETDPGYKGIRYEMGMGISDFLVAFGVEANAHAAATQDLLVKNKIILMEGQLRKESDRRPLAAKMIIQISDKFV